MNAAAVLLERGMPSSPALVTQEGSHTYAELRAAVGAVARFLASHGLRKGDAVALLSENSLFAFAAYLGTLYAGGVAVPLPTQLSPEHCRFILESTGARFAYVQQAVRPEFETPLRSVPTVVTEEAPWDTSATELPAPVEVCDREDLAVLLFTSGSTSLPRGVMLTHRNLLANTASILEYTRLTADDRVMMVLPFYYSFGASLLHTHLRVGASLVLDRRFVLPDKVLRRMQETRCTGFAGVPSHFQVLLRRSKLKSMTFPDLAWVQQAGGHLPSHFVQELQAALPQARLFVMYGATEATARLCYLPPELLSAKLGSIGKPIPGVTVELLDEAGRSVPPGEVGEIVASGENIARGYLGAAAETEATFRGGKLHTGDLARMDQDGFLYVLDRTKDFIKVGGNRTSSRLLEEQLLQFPDIVEAAVLGMPDEALGEAVAAFAVPAVASDPTVGDRLLAFCAQRMPAHLVPRRLTLLPSLPKSNAGKVMKHKLRVQLSGSE